MTRCPRCEKKYQAKLNECPHCKNIKDGSELEHFKHQHQLELEGGAELGKYFIGAAILVTLLLLMMSL